jgi:hypothetical protein
MTARAKQIADRFRQTSDEFIAVVERLSSEQWERVVPQEKRTVAAMAHHIGFAMNRETATFQAMAEGRPNRPYTWAEFDAANARFGEQYAHGDQAETVELLRANAVKAENFVRGLSEEQLDRRGSLMAEDSRDGSVANWIEWALIGHIEGHFPAIREAAGDE